MILANKLKHLGDIYDYEQKANELGGGDEANENQRKDWFSIQPVSHLKIRDHVTVSDGATHRLMCRFRGDIDSDTIINFTSLCFTFLVLDVMPDIKRRELMINARLKESSGV